MFLNRLSVALGLLLASRCMVGCVQEPSADSPNEPSPDGGTMMGSGSPADAYDHAGPNDGVSSEPLCDQILACGDDIAIGANQRIICAVRLGDRVSEACAAAVQAAPCSDHAIENPPYMDVCHPPCDVLQKSWCNDDLTTSLCSLMPEVVSDEGIPRWLTHSCTRACELIGSVAVECRDTPEDMAECVCESDL